ncbi:EAL domain-containing protein [Noviherbaspirillum sp.]|uniref:putative bifunctional diguanylate cyclase/phosphodiesterase n=1 Tax=Noviherbaspirillum sp. TaxID=1926288 RepID=UPI00342D3CE8
MNSNRTSDSNININMSPKTGFAWRWIKVIWPFLAGIALLGGLSAFSMDILSGSRAYVEGESLWSKAQKEAVFHLNRYAESRDAADFQSYLAAISVPLGDHKARMELEKASPDFDVARQGFLAGRNHPDDIGGMIRMFRNLRNFSFMRIPISIWAEGDAYIALLMAEADMLHAAVLSGNPSNASLRPILERIKQINNRLTPLEDAFSYSMGDASRRIGDLLLIVMLTIATALMCFASYISYGILARKESSEEKLRVVSARAAAAQERREADARIRDQAALLDKARDAIIVRAMDHSILYWNKSAERLYGWAASEAVGASIDNLIYDDAAVFAEATDTVMAEGEWSGEFTRRRDDGSMLVVESRWTLVRDDHGRPQSILAIDTDITKRKEAEHGVWQLAFYDPLTELPNRLLLQDRLRQALVASSHSHCSGALLFIDLDNFKALNDTLGHEKGDLLLQQVARRLSSCVRESDTVARLGGDEFVIMLTDLPEHRGEVAIQTKAVCEKILDGLRQPYSIDGVEQHSAASIGVALFQGRNDTVGELLKRADLAMYQAKASGRNTVRFFNQDMQAAVIARATLETDLRQGLRDGQFMLYYQPQMDKDGRMVGTEALIRWRHPTRGLVLPSRFIAISEETALILPLGQWVLNTACQQLAAWSSQPSMAGLSIAVNVSPRQFHHEQFVDQILGALENSGANPRQLKLELTESVLLDDVNATIAKMTELKARGVGFSLDDFGTGYSSLSYLKLLPLDQIKIDRSFVRDVLTDDNDAAIARTIIMLGQSLGLAVIAEGVETEEQRNFLARHDCNMYQGYLFSRPVPADQLESLLAA